LASSIKTNDILVHELQLGEQLNESVHSDRRSDFSLMLAMLTDDVRAHSQFKLPETDLTKATVNASTLRKTFQLPNEAPIALENLAAISHFNQAELIEKNQLLDLHLSNALSPKPLAFRNDAKFISKQVFENTSLYCQQRHQSPKAAESKYAFDAKAWLNAVQTTIVKSPLIEAYG
jgi:hypothetical protein